MEIKFLKIVFIIDESGSMQGSNADVIGGFNSFVERQIKENAGRITISLYKFNDIITRVIANKPAMEIKHLTNDDYTPGGFTALFDAIGKAISETDKELTELPENEKPDKVMVVIITDGQENASKEYSATAIKSAIATHEELLKWSFIFLGSGLDDFSDAEAIGIKYKANAPQWKLKSNINHVAESSIKFCMSEDKEENDILLDLIADLNDPEI